MVRQPGPKSGRRAVVEYSVVSACGRYRFTKKTEAQAVAAAAAQNQHFSALVNRIPTSHYASQIPYRVEVRSISAWTPNG